MLDSTRRTECGSCAALLETARTEAEAATPCPVCGSTLRNVCVSIEARATARDGVGMKAKRQGQKKPFVESLSVPSHSKTLGKVVHHERLIDRDNNRYEERVTDYETGQKIHEQVQPLSEHVGHGSAKKKHGPTQA